MPAPGQYRGTATEQAVERLLRGLGYLTASRRHIGGAGDILALRPPPPLVPIAEITAPMAALSGNFDPLAEQRRWPLLVEVKGTRDYPWASKWGPLERAELIATAERWGCEPLLAWWPPGIGREAPMWLPAEDWPPVPDEILAGARIAAGVIAAGD